MDLETAQTNTTAKLPILKQGEYDMWKLRIEQYFQVQDYALWDVIENGNSFIPAAQTTTNAKESIDFIFNRLQKIVSQLAILGENISQEDLNLKFLRSLPYEYNTYVVVWRNKPNLDTMSFDDLYNNFKIVKHEVKGTASSSSQNVAFVSSSSSTNEVNTAYGVSTANTQVSPASTQVSIASTQDSTANLSDATVYAFVANQPNGSKLVHENLEQIHEDDLEEIDLKWQLALMSMRTRRECKGPRNQDSRNSNQDSSRKTVNVEETSSKAMLAIDGASFDWSYMTDDEVPTNMALMAFSDSEGIPDASLVEELVSNDKLEKKTVFPTVAKINFVRPQQQEKPVRKPVKVIHKKKIKAMLTVDAQGNISYLSDFKEFDGGYVTFGGGAKGGRITCKGTLKTGKLDFEDKDGSLFDSSLKNASNDKPQPSSDAGKKDDDGVCKESRIADQEKSKNSTQGVNTIGPSINTESDMFSLGDNATATHDDFFGDETEVDMSNITTTYPVPFTLNTRIHKDHSLDHEEPKKTLVDLPHGKRAIGNKWVYRNKKDERVGRIEAIRLFLAYASFKDFVVYQMDVKSAFLYGKIEEEVYVCQPLGFEDPEFPNRVYKVDKALYGLHQAPRAWYETLSTYLLDNGF
ncbi:putative ribonuclease H-like domain-containing protein [Tanacetum coccineum]|uniref:Ribonuclease H-like domain-containing protein n=1 Tax=Tanacetum coccineum TaxID=301880 RepID=A0ABQ5B5N2_9ASTR